MCFTVLRDSGDAPVQCFFDFFIPLSSKTCGFEVLFGQRPSKNTLKRYHSVAEVPELMTFTHLRGTCIATHTCIQGTHAMYARTPSSVSVQTDTGSPQMHPAAIKNTPKMYQNGTPGSSQYSENAREWHPGTSPGPQACLKNA